MARFSVRVELLNAAGDAWDRLHAAMWKAGFRRVILNDERLWKLPTGSYIITAEKTVGTIRDEAQVIAEAIDKTALIWAVEYVDYAFLLKPIAEDPDAPKKPTA